MLSWKDKFDQLSRTFQLRLETWIRQILRIRLGLRTGRVYLIQDVYVAGSRRIYWGRRMDIRFLGKQTEITEVWSTRLGRA